MRRITLLLLCCLSLNTPLSAEEDFGVWTFLGLNKKISEVVSLYTEAEYRNRNDAETIDCWSLYGEVSARICPYLKGGAGYTFIKYNHPKLSWEPRHRINMFLTGNYSLGQWGFTIRERYEQVHRVLSDKSQPTLSPKRSLRSRIECTYRIPNSKFTPYVTLELYTTLCTTQAMKNEKTRYTLGTSISFNKQHAFSIYYRYIDMVQQESTDSHILGVGFRFNL